MGGAAPELRSSETKALLIFSKRKRNGFREHPLAIERETGGFTLLELSIAMVIIGLIVAGILVGQDLIRSAELRKVHRQYEELVTAVRAFQGKYNCLPGDCANATDYFGELSPGASPPDDAATCSAFPGAGITPGTRTCDGDGNGLLDGLPKNTGYEDLWLVQQLAAANLIAGTYSGAPSAKYLQWEAGYNCPAVINNGGFCWWFIDNLSMEVGLPDFSASIVAGRAGATMVQLPISVDYAPYPAGSGLFTPEEAWLYDLKFDDGRATTGQVNAVNSNWVAGCTDTQDADAVYDVGSENRTMKNCVLHYFPGF